MERADVVVIGGGPAGAATAAALARGGIQVVLIDKARFPREKLCGDYVHPLGTAVLADLGVLDALRSAARLLHGMRIVSPGGREVVAPFARGFGLSVSRTLLDETLLQTAAQAGADVRVERARRVARDGDRWRIDTDDGPLASRMIVGADGLRSRVAADAGLRTGPPRRGSYALGLRVRGVETPEDLAEMHLGRDAYCGVSAFPDGTANVTMVAPKPRLRFLRRGRAGPVDGETGCVDGKTARVDRETRRRLFAPFPLLRERMENAQIEGVRVIGPLAPWRGPVAGEGVVLVGDAAAFSEPLTGMGVSLALTGAAAAAAAITQALCRADHSPGALTPYARWHHRRMSRLYAFLRLVDWTAVHSPLIEPLARAWQRHPSLAANFLGVLGTAAPAREILAPAYVSRLLLACISRA